MLNNIMRPMDEKPNKHELAVADGSAETSHGMPPAVAAGGTPIAGSALSAEELDQLTADIVAGLKTVYDPEIPADIYELGLIYKIDIDGGRNVAILMTLTAPGCPVAGEMPQWVENAVARRYGRRSDEGHAHLRPAVGQGSHVGPSKVHAQYVLTAHLKPKRANSPPPVIAE